MDSEDKLIAILFIFVFCSIGSIPIIVGLSYVIGEEVVYSDYIVDTDYSQSGFGSPDIVVVYFEDSTLIIHEAVEINRNKYAEITVWQSPFLEGNRFVSIEYPKVRGQDAR